MVRDLGESQQNDCWRDRFGARWHFDFGGWIRTAPGAESSTFGLRPTGNYGPYVRLGG